LPEVTLAENEEELLDETPEDQMRRLQLLRAADAAKLDDECRRVKGTLRKMGEKSAEVKELAAVMRDLCEFGKPMEKDERRNARLHKAEDKMKEIFKKEMEKLNSGTVKDRLHKAKNAVSERDRDVRATLQLGIDGGKIVSDIEVKTIRTVKDHPFEAQLAMEAEALANGLHARKINKISRRGTFKVLR
jgi:hypothetical protein